MNKMVRDSLKNAKILYHRAKSVKFVLKCLVLFITLACLCLWLLETEYHVLPAKNLTELYLFYASVPVCLVLHAGFVLARLLGDAPPVTTLNVYLTTEYSLLVICGVIGVFNSVDPIVNKRMTVLSSLCLVSAILILVDLFLANGFIKKCFKMRPRPSRPSQHKRRGRGRERGERGRGEGGRGERKQREEPRNREGGNLERSQTAPSERPPRIPEDVREYYQKPGTAPQ